MEKSEANLAKVRAQWAKEAEEWAKFVQQMKRKYEGTITSLKRKMTTLENEVAKQAKDIKADREHCYDLIAQIEEEMQQLQNQHLHDTQVLEARDQQVGRLLREKELRQVVSLLSILATHPYNTRSKGELIMSNQKLDASSIDPSREVEELDVNSMKEEMYKLKQQMAEMYQAWAKGQPLPAYPVNPAFIPPLTQSQEHPTVDSSAGFPIYHHYQGTTSQTPQAPQPKPVPYPPPPATPVFVAPPPATIHRSSSEPLFRAHENQYYPLKPTFKALEPYSYTPRFDLPVEAEKLSKNPE
ncbi:uncharacterized protein [Nicotiana sylvestris]|uniref:uncharacterized protein n=1 Tax=Nicotiana sylvestris TaxID=4096 RepID=UPI00388C3705